MTAQAGLSVWKTALFYLAVWPLLAGITFIAGAIVIGGSNPSGYFSDLDSLKFLTLLYLFTAVPAVVSGLIIAAISPSASKPWLLPLISAICGALMFAVVGYAVTKAMVMFAEVGAVAGLGSGLLLMAVRRRFERT